MMEEIEEYDPLTAPDAEAWLGLDEAVRIALVLAYHDDEGARAGNEYLHATIHTVVENQLAMGQPPEVLDAYERLAEGGLDRHDVIHAIGSVLAGHLLGAAGGSVKGPDAAAAYANDLKDLTAASWLDMFKDA